MMKNIMLALLLLWSYPLLAIGELPPPFVAKYKLYAKGIPIGEGSRSLSQEGNKFIFRGETHTTGMLALFRDDKIQEKSIFTVNQGHVQPLEYTYDHEGSKKQKHLAISFDWQNKVAKNSADQPWEVPLVEGILDDQVYLIAVMQELQQGKRQLSYQVADDGKIKTYIPTYLGEEKIKTGVGELATLKYEHESANKKRKTTLWCAPLLHYLPVQIEHLEKGDTVRMTLQQVEGL